jgi:soluble lytic murein transglycosylase-like protein
LVMPALVMLSSVLVSASLSGTVRPESQATITTQLPDPYALMERARVASDLLGGVEGYYDTEIAPLERVLRSQRNDPELARRIALALVREGNRVGVSPRLLLGVMLVENPGLDTVARSAVGARGLMQVMPLHRGTRRSCDDMASLDGNICYGARIFASNLRESHGNVESALLRYNGCVHGTNTPNCQRYPHYVYTRVSRVNSVAARSRAGRAAAP